MKTPDVIYKPTLSQAPRFGSTGTAVPLTIAEKGIYGIADKFLRLSDIASEGVKNRFMRPGVDGPIRQRIGGALTWLSKNVLDHDYKEVCSLPKLGKVVVEPPMGALVMLLFGFTLAGRLNHAIHRAVGGDKRELRDIAFRDLPTFSLILFALKPMVQWMSKRLENFKGIQLTQGSTVFGYSQLENIYRVDSAHRLKSILANPANKKGIMAAIDQAAKHENLSANMRNLLGNFKRNIKDALLVHNGKGATTEGLLGALEKPAERAYRTLFQLNVEHGNYLRGLNLGRVPQRGLKGAIADLFIKKIPGFNEMFFRYAQSSRVWANAAAYIGIIGALGFGVTAFNQWFTEREFKKLQSGEQPHGSMF